MARFENTFVGNGKAYS